MPRQQGDLARLDAEARSPGRRRWLRLRRIPIVEVGQPSAAVVEHEDRAEIGGIAILKRPGDGFAAARGKLHIAEEGGDGRSEEHTSELQSLMRISYAFFCLQKKKY